LNRKFIKNQAIDRMAEDKNKPVNYIDGYWWTNSQWPISDMGK